ncbi:MAG: hypothetical protein IKF36_00830 [Bacilli bacterium]|nr:hypothetical protein [Bacilli bacterium]
MRTRPIANKKVISTFLCCMCFLLVLYCTLSQIDIKNISSGNLKASAADIEETTTEIEVIDTNKGLSKENGLTLRRFAEVAGFGNVELQYSGYYYVSDNPLTVSKGALYFNGHKETYYSERVLPGNGLYIPGRHVADDGTIRDADGYIAVAADPSYLPRGTVVMTSVGPARVYDTGCAYGTVDIYVSW